ncbi:MAG: stage II sporulation protein R [Lachnospiraceae bacterium]|nr:stage II sporulation protein R [Lachnospiraceae bacterium]
MNRNKTQETKRWVLLEHLPYQHSRRILLILFLYSLAFTLLLVGLRMFCHNLSMSELEIQETTGSQTIPHQQNVPGSQNIGDSADLADTSAQDDTQNSYTAENFQNNQNINQASHIQQDIADHIIRLHVIAQSDTDEDQALKLKVRDEVLSQIQNSLIPADTQAAAEIILDNLIPSIQNIAQNKILAEGYNYPVHVVLEERYFPAKTYGDLTFPPGTYQALCIEIGEAKGKNWWCVLFPSLCFVNETTAEVPESSKEKLEDSLTEEAYHSLSNQSSPTSVPTAKPEFHSAIYDWIRSR